MGSYVREEYSEEYLSCQSMPWTIGLSERSFNIAGIFHARPLKRVTLVTGTYP